MLYAPTTGQGIIILLLHNQLCSFKFPIVLCELCFVLHFHSFIVLLAVLFVDLVHCILLIALRLSRPSCNQVVSDCFWNIKLTYLLTRKVNSFSYLFGEVVIHDKSMSSIVPKELAHGAARVRSQVLQRRRVWRRRAHYDCVFHSVGVGQSLHNLRHCRPLLTNRDVDAIQLGFLVLAVVESLLIDDGVNCHRRLAANTIRS